MKDNWYYTKWDGKLKFIAPQLFLGYDSGLIRVNTKVSEYAQEPLLRIIYFIFTKIVLYECYVSGGLLPHV